MTVPITLPGDRIERSKQRAEIVAGKLKWKNYDGQSNNAFHRYFCGYLGEETATLWLEHEQIKYTHLVSTEARSMGPEIVVGRYTLEVKGIGRPTRNTLIVGANRDLSASGFVVARSRVDDYALGDWELVTWFRGSTVRACPLNATRFGSPVRELPLDSGLPIYRLAAALRGNVAVSVDWLADYTRAEKVYWPT